MWQGGKFFQRAMWQVLKMKYDNSKIMKPNEKQIKVCAILSAQIEFWAMSNDIMSASLFSDLSAILNDGVNNEELLQCEAEDIEVKIIELLICIRSLK